MPPKTRTLGAKLLLCRYNIRCELEIRSRYYEVHYMSYGTHGVKEKDVRLDARATASCDSYELLCR